jgi:hypothetical protein
MLLITTFLIKYKEKLTFREKNNFCHIFRERWRSVSDIFVERIKLYHNLMVHEKCIFIYQDAELEKKTPKSVGKKLSIIMTPTHFYVPNYDASLKN